MLDSVRGSHVVLLIGLAWVVQTAAQGCMSKTPKCNFIQDTVECNNLRDMPLLWWEDMNSQFTHLIFQNGYIPSITKTSLPPGIETISLNKQTVDHISEDAFDLSATSLRKVYISSPTLHRLPIALSNLTVLEDLRIENTPIQDWNSATLQQIAHSLVYLKLRNVSLSAWPVWMSYFGSLHTLDLSYNPLASIPNGAFSSFANSLTHLKLIGTNLTHVPAAISSLSVLDVVEIGSNRFTDEMGVESVSPSLFPRSLTSISITSAGMTHAPNFSSFPNLNMIDFSSNSIHTIRSGTFPPSLLTLRLNDNSLTTLPSDLATLPRLGNLNLRQNQIIHITPHSLTPSLTILDLGLNRIITIRRESFRNLTHLELLFLDQNPLTVIAPTAFSSLISLTYLSLYRTHLTEIPLEFTSLDTEIQISMTTVQPLSCPCPANQQLVQWYASLIYTKLDSVKCSHGLSVDTYLAGQCPGR